MATTNTRIVIRRDVSTTWSTVNPELLTGEQGLETDTGKLKIGEGKTWNATGYSAYLPSEVDAKVSDEATVRAGVDNTLQTDLNGAKARIEVLEADPTTSAYVDAQVSAEATARTSADTTEASTRAAADTTLQGNIDTVDGRVTAETAGRIDAFSQLDTAINANTQAISDETASREAADNALTDIDTALGNRISTLESESATETYVDNGLALKADLTGATFTGDVEAVNITSTGTITGNVTGALTGPSQGNHTGNVYSGDGTTVLVDASAGNLKGYLIGTVNSTNETTVLDPGSDGTDATFTGSVTGNVTGNAATASLADVATAVTVGSDVTGTPAAVGLFAVDGAGTVHISVGTADSGDWIAISA